MLGIDSSVLGCGPDESTEAVTSAKSVTGFRTDKIEIPIAVAVATKILAMTNRSEMTALSLPLLGLGASADRKSGKGSSESNPSFVAIA
jgi:hypothetical protein